MNSNKKVFYAVGISHAKATVKGVGSSHRDITTTIFNRKLIVLNIETLISALQDNLTTSEQKLNRTPALDLKLHDDKELLEEVRRLAKALEETRELLQNNKIPVTEAKASNLEQLTKAFLMGLGGKLGLETGEVIKVLVINIMNYFNLSIDDLI